MTMLSTDHRDFRVSRLQSLVEDLGLSLELAHCSCSPDGKFEMDADEGTLQSYEELSANLKEYQDQLKAVEDLLLDDAENDELHDMYKSLEEVINLTNDLLKDAREQHDSHASAVPPNSSNAHAAPSSSNAPSSSRHTSLTAVKIVTPPQLNLPSILPASVAEQLKRAQVKASLMGQSDPSWAIGAKAQAIYSGDGQYYTCTVEAVIKTDNPAASKFIVQFEGYPDREEVPVQSIRPMPEMEAVYQGVQAPKRKRVEEAEVVTEVPKWLEIRPEDDEKTKARKKKLIKSYKSKMRFQSMDLAQAEKQSSWQSFQSGKGAKKKTGFLTGAIKKESIFKSNEQGPVGVMGAGRGMTSYAKTGKHQFADE